MFIRRATTRRAASGESYFNSLEQVQPRSVGVEHLTLTALEDFGLDARLKELGVPTITLYDLTNTYFEGQAAENGKARQVQRTGMKPPCGGPT